MSVFLARFLLSKDLFSEFKFFKCLPSDLFREKQILSFKVIWPKGYKTFSMFNSVQHENLNAQKCKNIEKSVFFLGSEKPKMLFFPAHNVKMSTIVGILTLMSRKSFMLS